MLQWFNTSSVGFLNPETYGETLAFTGLTVLVFLLLMVLLMLLLRNILKLYATQSSSALGSRLQTRMVLGAASSSPRWPLDSDAEILHHGKA